MYNQFLLQLFKAYTRCLITNYHWSKVRATFRPRDGGPSRARGGGPGAYAGVRYIFLGERHAARWPCIATGNDIHN